MNVQDQSKLTDRLVNQIRGPDESFMARWAELFKDLLLDWDIGDDPEREVVFDDNLPALAEEAFVEAMRGPVEQTLRRVAEAINQAPAGNIIEASEEQVCRLLAELWAAALETGVQMRLDAAELGPSPVPAPQGAWARRFRRMIVAGPGMPLTETLTPATAGNP